MKKQRKKEICKGWPIFILWAYNFLHKKISQLSRRQIIIGKEKSNVNDKAIWKLLKTLANFILWVYNLPQ